MPEEERGTDDEDDEDFDEDKLTEESYRTTFDTNPEDLECKPMRLERMSTSKQA